MLVSSQVSSSPCCCLPLASDCNLKLSAAGERKCYQHHFYIHHTAISSSLISSRPFCCDNETLLTLATVALVQRHQITRLGMPKQRDMYLKVILSYGQFGLALVIGCEVQPEF
jgi:hypothetical protein